jgi:tRNA(fMet)-specific endonuclease VapC
MSLYILDTDIFSLYQNTHPRVLTKIVQHLSDRLAVSVITLEEQVSGWQRALRRARSAAHEENAFRRLAETAESYSGWPILPMTQSMLTRYQVLLRAKLGVRASDLRIAATALEAGGIVVSRNLSDFRRVPNLICEDWAV